MPRDVGDPSQKIRARARLALRAEQAFGLNDVPIQITATRASIAATPAATAMQLPQSTQAPPVSEVRKAVVKLFEGPPEPAVAKASGPSGTPITGKAYSTEEKRRLL